MNNIFVKIAVSILKGVGSEGFKQFLQHLHDTHKDTYEAWLTSAYPLIDGAVEDYVITTASKVDDGVIALLKKICEESAADNGLVLPNNDAGKIND